MSNYPAGVTDDDPYFTDTNEEEDMREAETMDDDQRPLSTEELLTKQNESLDWVYDRLRIPVRHREYVAQPELPDWVAAVDENGLSRGYQESYDDFQQRL